VHRSRHARARYDHPGPARVPLEQDARREASRPHAHAALSQAAEVWAREALRRVAHFQHLSRRSFTLHPSRQGGEFLNIFSVAFAIFGKSEASLALSRSLSRT